MKHKKIKSIIVLIIIIILTMPSYCYAETANVNKNEEITNVKENKDNMDEKYKEIEKNIKEKIDKDYEEKWNKNVERVLDNTDKALNGIYILSTVISMVVAIGGAFAAYIAWRYGKYKEYAKQLDDTKAEIDNIKLKSIDEGKCVHETLENSKKEFEEIQEKAKKYNESAEEIMKSANDFENYKQMIKENQAELYNLLITVVDILNRIEKESGQARIGEVQEVLEKLVKDFNPNEDDKDQEFEKLREEEDKNASILEGLGGEKDE